MVGRVVLRISQWVLLAVAATIVCLAPVAHSDPVRPATTPSDVALMALATMLGLDMFLNLWGTGIRKKRRIVLVSEIALYAVWLLSVALDVLEIIGAGHADRVVAAAESPQMQSIGGGSGLVFSFALLLALPSAALLVVLYDAIRTLNVSRTN
jgi:hypothetical protein